MELESTKFLFTTPCPYSRGTGVPPGFRHSWAHTIPCDPCFHGTLNREPIPTYSVVGWTRVPPFPHRFKLTVPNLFKVSRLSFSVHDIPGNPVKLQNQNNVDMDLNTILDHEEEGRDFTVSPKRVSYGHPIRGDGKWAVPTQSQIESGRRETTGFESGMSTTGEPTVQLSGSQPLGLVSQWCRGGRRP